MLSLQCQKLKSFKNQIEKKNIPCFLAKFCYYVSLILNSFIRSVVHKFLTLALWILLHFLVEPDPLDQMWRIRNLWLHSSKPVRKFVLKFVCKFECVCVSLCVRWVYMRKFRRKFVRKFVRKISVRAYICCVCISFMVHSLHLFKTTCTLKKEIIH